MPLTDLMETLAAERRTRRCAEVWREVAEGRMSPGEAAAQQDGQEPEDIIAASRMLFAPPDPSERDALIERATPSALPPSLAVARSRNESRRRLAWGAAALAVAAAVALVVALPQERTDVPEPTVVAELGVRFELELSGGFATKRGADASETPDAAPVELPVGSQFELVVRPEVKLPGDAKPDLAVYAFAEGASRAISVEVERAASGTMIVAGRVGDVLDLAPGEWTLVVVVAPAGHLPERPEAVAPGASTPGHWQLLRERIRIVGESR